MRPFLSEGDHVGVEWVSESYSPQVGEIVIYRDTTGSWIVHRVITADLAIKGDSSFVIEPLPPSSVWGKVVSLRKPNSTIETELKVSWVDRWIALISGASLHSNRILRKVLRLSLYGLAWSKRKTL